MSSRCDEQEYDSADFRKVADFLLSRVPNMTLATDVICGFGETEEQHDETLALVEEYKFPVLNISKFYPRRGTPAARMKQLDSKVKKKRSGKMTKMFLSYTCYERMAPVGTVHTAWVANEVSSDGTHSVAHTKSYIKVLIPKDETLKGAKIRVRITKTAKFHVEADIEHIYFKHRGFDHAAAAVVDAADARNPNEGETKSNSKEEAVPSVSDST